MKKYMVAMLVSLTLGMVGCSSTSDAGGDKAEKRTKSVKECKDSSSRLKKRC